MIIDKMEIEYLIQSLNELEKLKLLLFDHHQRKLFELIPKPYLIDYSLRGANLPYEEDPENLRKDEVNLKSDLDEEIKSKSASALSNSRRSIQHSEDIKKILVSNSNGFWDKEGSDKHTAHNFSKALDAIRKKDKLNMIDERLFDVLNIDIKKFQKKQSLKKGKGGAGKGGKEKRKESPRKSYFDM